jgi:hypothetical protein
LLKSFTYAKSNSQIENYTIAKKSMQKSVLFRLDSCFIVS